MEKIQSNTTHVTEYEIDPATGWTRNDIVLALRSGNAHVQADQIVQVADGANEGSEIIATVVSERTVSSGTEWR
jgi:hypothetical protein